MMKRALIPRSSACCTIFFVFSRSLLTYLGSYQHFIMYMRPWKGYIQLHELYLARNCCVDQFVERA